MQRTILVADDDPALVQRLVNALEEKGYGLRVAYNSDEVLVRINTEMIDLLVLGDALPDQGGLAIVEWLRSNARSRDMPVILLTSNMYETDVYRAWQNRVDSFQSKRETAIPLITLELLAKIKRIFKSIDEDGSPWTI